MIICCVGDGCVCYWVVKVDYEFGCSVVLDGDD